MVLSIFRFIGGIIYTFGAVQEEILFLQYPELLISRLFTQKLEDTEAFLFTGNKLNCFDWYTAVSIRFLSENIVTSSVGPERFCLPKGYSATFGYSGNYIDTIPSDSYGRKYTQIIGIDATRYGRFGAKNQYEISKIAREINKVRMVCFCYKTKAKFRAA